MENISLTVPMRYSALCAAAKMFAAVAKGLQPDYIEETLREEAEITGDGTGEALPVIIEPVVDHLTALPVQQSPVVQPVVTGVDLAAPEGDQSAVASVTQTPAGMTNIEELDSVGLPWDERIHRKSRAKLAASGEWTKTPGIAKKQPGLIEQVEAENRARIAATSAPLEFEMGPNGQAEPVANAAAVFGQQPQVTQPAAVVTQPVVTQPVVTQPVVTQPVVTQPAAVVPITFAELLQRITPRQQAKPEYSQTVLAVLAEFGMASLPELAGKDGVLLADNATFLLNSIMARLDQLWQG